jgi:hypothetical protein
MANFEFVKMRSNLVKRTHSPDGLHFGLWRKLQPVSVMICEGFYIHDKRKHTTLKDRITLSCIAMLQELV